MSSTTKVAKSKFGTLAVQQAISTRNVKIRKNRNIPNKLKFSQVAGIGRRVFQHQLVFGKIKDQNLVSTIEKDVDAIAITNLNEHVTTDSVSTFGNQIFFAGVALTDSSSKQNGDTIAVARTGLLTVINSGHQKIQAGDHVMWLLPTEIDSNFSETPKGKNPIGYYGDGLPDNAVHPVLASYNADNILKVPNPSVVEKRNALLNAGTEAQKGLALNEYAKTLIQHEVDVKRRVIGFALSSAEVGKPIDVFFM